MIIENVSMKNVQCTEPCTSPEEKNLIVDNMKSKRVDHGTRRSMLLT